MATYCIAVSMPDHTRTRRARAQTRVLLRLINYFPSNINIMSFGTKVDSDPGQAATVIQAAPRTYGQCVANCHEYAIMRTSHLFGIPILIT